MDLNILYLAGSSLLVGLAVFVFVYFNFRELKSHVDARVESIMGGYRGKFEALFMNVDMKAYAVKFFAALLGLPFLAYALTRNAFLAILTAAIVYFLPSIQLNRKAKQRLERLNLQIMDTLSMISNSVKAGLTLPQAFENVKNQMVPPISQEIGLLLKEYKLGLPFDETLSNWAKRVPSTNVDIFVSSILISRRSGGDVAEVLETMSGSMKEIYRLEGKLDAMTSQGRAQGWVLSMLPLILGGALYYLDPTFIIPLLTTPQGYAVCMLIVLFWAIGIFFIWKIISVEV